MPALIGLARKWREGSPREGVVCRELHPGGGFSSSLFLSSSPLDLLLPRPPDYA